MVEEGVGGTGEESGDAPGTGGTGGRWVVEQNLPRQRRKQEEIMLQI